MALTEEQRQRALELAPKYRSQISSTYIPPSQWLNQKKMQSEIGETKGFIDNIMRIPSKIGEAIGQRGGKVAESAGNILMGKERLYGSGGLNIVGQTVGGASDITGAVISPVVSPVINGIAQTETGKALFENLGKGYETYENWKNSSEVNKQVGRDFENILELTGAAPSGMFKSAGKQLLKNVLRQTTKEGAEQVGKQALKEGVGQVSKQGIKKGLEQTTKGAVEFGGKMKDYITTQLSGMQPKTIQNIIKSGNKIKKAQADGLSKITLGDRFKALFEGKARELSETGRAYNPIRESNISINVDPNKYTNFIKDKYGLDIADGELVRTSKTIPMSNGDVNALQEFIDLFGNKEVLSANEFLNARGVIANIAKFDSTKTGAAKTLASDLYKLHNELRDQIPGLETLDNQFKPQKELISTFENKLFDKNGDIKPSGLTYLYKIVDNSSPDNTTLKMLREIYPDIEDDINILRTLSDIEYAKGRTVGAYLRSGVQGAALVTGNMPAMLGAIISMPDILVPLLTKYGKIREGINIDDIFKRMRSGAKLTKTEKTFVSDALQNAARLMIEMTPAGVTKETMQQ